MKILFLLSISAFLCGCTVVSANRVFPKAAWYWSKDAEVQRDYQSRVLVKQELLTTLNARDTQVLDLVVVGKGLVTKYGINKSRKAVIDCWTEQTGGVSPSKASDVMWLKDQSTCIRDLGWLYQFQREWTQ